MKKKQSICPKCNIEYKGEVIKPRRGAAAELTKPEPKNIDPPDSEEALIDAELDDDDLDAEDDKTKDDTIMEDTSDIGGDVEDIGEVIGVVDDTIDKE